MKADKLQDAIGMVDDDLIKDAEKSPKKKRNNNRWWFVAAAAVVLLVSIGISWWTGNDEDSKKGESKVVENNSEAPSLSHEENNLDLHTYAIAECSYPKQASYPDETKASFMEELEAWMDEQMERKKAYEEADVDINSFLTTSIETFLSDSNGENKVFSPLNVYMALAMLAEVTDGNSRGQILELLGSDSIDSLRTQANALWNGHYVNNEGVISILAGSLWLNKDINYKQETLDYLANNYYASSYSGEMGSQEFNEALAAWLNEQTGGMLEEQIDGIEMSPETIMTLAATIYFNARWADKFSETYNTTEVFHGVNGDTECEFMNQDYARTYYWGDKFSAVEQGLEESGGMWFILPDEGATVDELLKDEEVMNFIFANREWENNKFLNVNLSVPKFDVTSQIDLSEGLKELGVTDVFDDMMSDFTPMTSDVDGISLSEATHGARVTIDEEGCTATAFTVMMASGSAMQPEDEIDFVVDRPFIFVITSDVGMPLFVGVVNQIN